MMVTSSDIQLVEGMMIAVNFFLPSGVLVMVRGIVRAVVPAKDKLPLRYGIEFVNLGFHYKREIRNFVAAATRGDGHI